MGKIALSTQVSGIYCPYPPNNDFNDVQSTSISYIQFHLWGEDTLHSPWSEKICVYGLGYVVSHVFSTGGWISQLGVPVGMDGLFIRHKDETTKDWTPWKKISYQS